MSCRLLTSVAIGAVSVVVCIALGATAQESIPEIRIAVFKDFVSDRSTKRPQKNPAYSIYFLDLHTEKERKELNKFFRSNNPPVECGTNNMLVKDGLVLDKRTSKSARLFTVDIQTTLSTNATAYAYAYAARFGGECYVYQLQVRTNQWVVSKKYLNFLH